MRSLKAVLAMTLLVFSACDFEGRKDHLTGVYLGTQNFGIGQISSPIAIDLIQRGNTLDGTITPPFSRNSVRIVGGEVRGIQIRFETKESLGSINITNRYDCSLEGAILKGDFSPLGCVEPASGETCPTDLNGSFTAIKQ